MSVSDDPSPIIYITTFEVPPRANEEFEASVQDNRRTMERHPACVDLRVLRSVSLPTRTTYLIQSTCLSEAGFESAWAEMTSGGRQTPPLPPGTVARRMLFQPLPVTETTK